MAEPQMLPVHAVRQQLPRLGNYLSKADYDRLEALLPLFTPAEASQADLATCLDQVATGRTTQEQLADFRAFRGRLRQAARKAGLGLELEVDSRKRSHPQGRHCWFSQPSAHRTADVVAAFQEEARIGVDPDTTIKSRAMVPGVQVAVWYDTQHDHTLAQQLLKLLRTHCDASPRAYAPLWDAGTIPPGAHRAEEQQAAWRRADVVLLLVSPAWLARLKSDVEVYAGVADKRKSVIPVVLENVDAKLHDLHALEGRELFWLQLQRGKPKSFADCDVAHKKQFVQQLFECIERQLDSTMARQEEQSRPSPHDQIDLDDYATLAHAWPGDPTDQRRIVHARAQEANVRAPLEDSDAERAAAHSVVALEALQQWALDPHEAPYCALLGEYGIGKTTTLKQFTHTLLEKRRAGHDVPLPIFIDLRFHSPTIHRGEVPDLETLLQEMLDRAWTTTHRPAFTAADILRLVREEGAIVIFDGLDEKLVHLDETQGRAFLRTLWNALPPFEVRPERAMGRADRQRAALADTETQRPRGRLIFSCRSHYFKTLRDQNAMLR